MNRRAWIDFETRSRCDLTARGLAAYAADPTTEALCLAYRLPGEPFTRLWVNGEPPPAELLRHIAQGGEVEAHNAAFDVLIFARAFNVPIPWSQVHCSAARARYHGLPGNLGDACEALQLPIRKNPRGKELIKIISIGYGGTPQDFQELYDYCRTDVDAMVGLSRALPPLPPREVELMQLDFAINDRGLGADVQLAGLMDALHRRELLRAGEDIAALTSGRITTAAQSQRILAWLAENDDFLDATDRAAVDGALASASLDESSRKLLTTKQAVSRAPKKPAAIVAAQVSGRLRHGLMYYGAQSGRWAAVGCGGAQLHNFARPRPGKDDAAMTTALLRGDVTVIDREGPPLAALADMQRQLIVAPRGKLLVVADLSAIEARKLAWLAWAEPKLDAFRNGLDQYKVSAVGMYNTPYEQINKDQRQSGKIAELALGFAGAAGALISMAAVFKINMPLLEANETVRKWRRANPTVVQFWFELLTAAHYSVATGQVVELDVGQPGGGAKLVFHTSELGLHIELPSGRALTYRAPRLALAEPSDRAPTLFYTDGYGAACKLDHGVLANNVTQGLARDVFADCLTKLKDCAIVHHIHDELLIEAPAAEAEATLKRVLEVMSETPRWAPGLPVKGAGFVAERWTKD